MRNPAIIQLAERIGRTPGAVALKACNFASCDPRLRAEGIRGMRNSSRADRDLFTEFLENPDSHLAELEKIDANVVSIDESTRKFADDFPEGRNVKRTASTRRGQSFFREAIYANYDGRCAMSGLQVDRLLTASHIIPWSKNKKLRCNPQNGLLLSALHDRAFDAGLITVGEDFKILVSGKLAKFKNDAFLSSTIRSLQGKVLRFPKRLKFLPLKAALEYHRDVIFES